MGPVEPRRIEGEEVLEAEEDERLVKGLLVAAGNDYGSVDGTVRGGSSFGLCEKFVGL